MCAPPQLPPIVGGSNTEILENGWNLLSPTLPQIPPQAGGESGGESLSSGGFWLGVDSPPEWVTPPHLVGE